MKKVILGILAIILVGCNSIQQQDETDNVIKREYVENMEQKYKQLNSEINELSEENHLIKEENKITIEKNKLIEEENVKLLNEQNYVTDYNAQKWPMPVGIKTYNGKTKVHIFPNILAPTIESFQENQVIEAFDYVWSHDWSSDNQDKGLWYVIRSSQGVIGFVNEESIGDYIPDENAKYLKFSDVTETISSCTVGDRIEKLIGALDQDYISGLENGRIYSFLDDEAILAQGEDRFSPFQGGGVLTTFVDVTNHIILIRTDSPIYLLDSGFGVGSKAIDVKNYYDSLYDYDGDAQSLTYRVGENTNLSFTRDTEELTKESIIMHMQISLSSWD